MEVIVPKEVAEAIETLRKDGFSDYGIICASEERTNDEGSTLRNWTFGNGGANADKLVRALVNGYEIEKSAEELRENTLREYYRNAKYQMATNGLAGLAASHAYAEGRAHAIERTLEILGIKIEGVNA